MKKRERRERERGEQEKERQNCGRPPQNEVQVIFTNQMYLQHLEVAEAFEEELGERKREKEKKRER